MVDVVSAAWNQSNRTDIIKVVADVAERFLEWINLGPEQLHKFMKRKVKIHERRRGRRFTERSEEYTEIAGLEIHEDDRFCFTCCNGIQKFDCKFTGI